jgi:hypothetical protein
LPQQGCFTFYLLDALQLLCPILDCSVNLYYIAFPLLAIFDDLIHANNLYFPNPSVFKVQNVEKVKEARLGQSVSLAVLPFLLISIYKVEFTYLILFVYKV